MPPKLIPLFAGEADVRAADGGRGSAKTRTFAKMTAIRALMWDAAGRSGQILCGRQFMNSLADSSLEEIKAAIRSESWMLPAFDIGEKYIKTKSGRVYYTFTGLDRNVASVKSKARILLCWVDEAEPVTENAWTTLIPTLREEDSELWVTWNARRKSAPVEKRFKSSVDPRIKYVRVNWRDNPWFPDILERQRQRDLRDRPDQYPHIWEGEYVSVVDGAYYAAAITAAKAEGRICRVAQDPLMTKRAVWDIGGTGAKADACAIWIVQYVGREIRLLDYYEAQGQPLATHVEWLRGNEHGKAMCILPHDGATNDRVHDVSYESALRAAGFEVQVIANQGAGAAMKRVEAARRLFPSMWFDEMKCAAGLEALGWYHERRDEDRSIGLGPEHDWSSHGCFHGDTKVVTRYGTQRIMDLAQTGEVLTPCGWKRYILPRITIQNARLVEVEFTGGHTVKCTPDHLFLTANGWRSAESLAPNTVIQSTLTKSHNTLTAGFTGFGRAKHIFQGAAGGFTAMLGKALSDRFRRVATFTTATGMFSTTCFGISNAFPHQSILPRAVQSVLSHKTAGFQQQQKAKPQIGTHLTKDDFGTSATLNGHKAGQSGREKKSRASIAAPCTWLWYGRAARLVNIALIRANRRPTDCGQSDAARLQIARVRHITERADVWDITVPGVRCFSLANGAVVHNSDAFGLVAVAYELPPSGAKEPKWVPRKVV